MRYRKFMEALRRYSTMKKIKCPECGFKYTMCGGRKHYHCPNCGKKSYPFSFHARC